MNKLTKAFHASLLTALISLKSAVAASLCRRTPKTLTVTTLAQYCRAAFQQFLFLHLST